MFPFNDNEFDGEESTISFSGFPPTAMMTAAASDSHNSSSLGLFEFSTASTKPIDDMCAADDVILNGKLLPLAALPPPQHNRKETTHVFVPDEFDHHRRSNSMGDPPPRGFWGGKGNGEYRKLKRVPDLDSKGAAAPAVNPLKPRTRWYVLVFGSVKIPAAMELKEIRIRQRRRSTPPLERKAWGPWKLLRSLSCKGMEAVVVS